MKPSVFFLSLLALLGTVRAFSATEKRLFTLEKSYHPDNILVIHTQTDDNCKFVSQNNGYINFYWLMSGTTKKSVHSLIVKEIKERVKFVSVSPEGDSFQILLNDLKEVKHDLASTTVEITAEVENGSCVVKSNLSLGASARYRKMNVTKTYCEVTKNLVGIPNGCKYLELSGVDSDTSEAFSARFLKK